MIGIPRWAAPWAADWSDMATNSKSDEQRELSSLGHGEESAQVHALPKNAQRRLQRIGFAASGIAATVWLLAMVRVWQITT